MKTILLLVMAAATMASAVENPCLTQMREQAKKACAENLIVDYGFLDGKVDESKPIGLEFGLEPYGLISWTGLNGNAELGAGLAVSTAITKNLAIVGFGEADDTTGIFVDRFGGGLRYTAYLGKKVSLDGGIALAYDLPLDNSFVRLPFGLNLTPIRTKNVDLSIRVQYAFDIDGNGKHGTATGRAFVGPVFGFKF